MVRDPSTASASTTSTSSYGGHHGSNAEDEAAAALLMAASVTSSPKSFPCRLHSILSSLEHSGKVMEWLPHGRSWRVLRWEALADPDLLSWLGVDSDTAFSESIQRWGFRETRSGADRGSFQHGLFLRGRPELCLEMKPIILQRHRDSPEPLPTSKTPVATVTPSQEYSTGSIVTTPSDTSSSPEQSNHKSVFRRRDSSDLSSWAVTLHHHQSQNGVGRVVSTTPSYQPPNNDVTVATFDSLSNRLERQDKDNRVRYVYSANQGRVSPDKQMTMPVPVSVPMSIITVATPPPREESELGPSYHYQPYSAAVRRTPGLRSTRGRARRIADAPPPSLSSSAPKSRFTVSTRGGRKRRIVSSEPSYHVPILSERQQYLSSYGPPPPPPPPQQFHCPSSFSRPAVAVSRKTKRFRTSPHHDI